MHFLISQTFPAFGLAVQDSVKGEVGRPQGQHLQPTGIPASGQSRPMAKSGHVTCTVGRTRPI
jgi:hypothetical protein